MPKVTSRKFISPAFSGDKISFRDKSSINDKERENSLKPKEQKLPSCSLSDSQYDELFREVIKESSMITEDKKRGNVLYPKSEKEDNVVIPEPNAALSPDEEADATNDDKISDWTAVKTPENPIDNSELPPIQKKKRISRFAYLANKSKLKPTRLNFDDPDMGKPEKLPKTQKPSSLSTYPSKNNENHKKIDKPEGYVKRKITKNISTKNKSMNPHNVIDVDENGRYSEEVCKKHKLQNNLVADGREAVSFKQKKLRSPNNDKTQNSSRNESNEGNHSFSPTMQSSSQVLGSQASSLSDSQVLSQRSRLIKLQKKRNVGLWVQCTKKDCSKWRYLASTRDPTEVPEDWQCSMNQDKNFARCSVPEKGPTPLEEEDLIHNLYTAGSLVWAHLNGYPWWPAIVDDDPDVEQYYWINDLCDIPTHYSVAFFDEKPVTRAWVTPNALTKYKNPEKKKDFDKTIIHGVNYSGRLKVAKSQADEALKYPIDERLRRFSFVARYKGTIGNRRKIIGSPDENKKKRDKKDNKSKLEKLHSELDSPSDIVQSLETVKEINKVLSQLTSNSESEEGSSEESHQIKENKSYIKSVKSSMKNKKKIAKPPDSDITGLECNTDSEEESNRKKQNKARIPKNQEKHKSKNKVKETTGKDQKTDKEDIFNKEKKSVTQGKGKKVAKCEEDVQKREKNGKKLIKPEEEPNVLQEEAINTSELDSDKEGEKIEIENICKMPTKEKPVTEDGYETPRKRTLDVNDDSEMSNADPADGILGSNANTLIDSGEEIEEVKSNEGYESPGNVNRESEEWKESDIDSDRETVIEETASELLPLPASHSGRASADLFELRPDNMDRLSVVSEDFEVEE